MSEGEYEVWLEPTIAGYAAHHVAEGNWSEDEALERSRGEFATLLPEGVATPGAYVFTVRDGESGEDVGMIWFTLRPKAGRVEAFVYEVSVHEKYRGRGYGRATMRAAAERAHELGCATVGLHVHGHNSVARALYRSLGYDETDVLMSLEL
jgi:ribosomal protein S18 acetylase RimI-like enzyme